MQPSLKLFRGLARNLLDYVLFLPGIWLVCGLGAGIRVIGPLFVLIPAFSLLYAMLRLVVPPRLLTVYVLYCIFAGVLSVYRVFPASWQVHFMQEAIVKQLVPTVTFLAVAWGAKAYFRRNLLYGNVFHGAPFILALSFVVALAVMFQQGLGYQGDYSTYAKIAAYGSFSNNTLIAMFFILGYIFFTHDWRRYLAICTILGVALTTHFVQFRLWALVVLATLCGAPGRKVLIGVIAMLIGGYVVAMNFVPQMMIEDPNDGLRVVLVKDALSSTIDTRGIGIGYGTESIRSRYQFPGMPDFTFLPAWSTMTQDRMLEALSNSVENSFVMPFLRTGIIGGFLFLATIFAAFPPRNLSRSVRNHATTTFAILFISCFVNAGVDTPIQVVGVGFLYGYLLALRAAVSTRTQWVAMPSDEGRAYVLHPAGKPGTSAQ
jgi:hypothetical protein